MKHYVRKTMGKNSITKTYCGKILKHLPEGSEITRFMDETTCKDCINDMILTKQASIFKQKKMVNTLTKMFIALGSVALIMSCSLSQKQRTVYGKPAVFKDQDCLKWEMGDCVHILNKDVIFLEGRVNE